MLGGDLRDDDDEHMSVFPSPEQLAEDFGVSVEEVRIWLQTFLLFDKDESESISKEEMVSISGKLGLPFSESDWVDMRDAADVHGEGKEEIGIADFMEWMASHKKTGKGGKPAAEKLIQYIQSLATSSSLVLMGPLGQPIRVASSTIGQAVHKLAAFDDYFVTVNAANRLLIYGEFRGLKRDDTSIDDIDGGIDGSSSTIALRHRLSLATLDGTIQRIDSVERNVAEIACGKHHVLVLLTNGDILSMGLGSHGQLGQGLLVSRSVFENVQNTFDGRVRHVACGAMHSMAVCENGHLFGWGINENGMLGVESDEERISIPTRVDFTSVPGMSVEVDMISCGPFHSACVDATGALYTWGNGGQGRLGHGHRSSESIPTHVKLLHQMGLRIVAVACGSAHTVAIAHNGAVYAWGCGLHGRLGNGSQCDAWSPIKVIFKEPHVLRSGEQFRRVSCGAFHSVAVTSEGRIAVWGCNRDGQLGIDPLQEIRTIEEGKVEVKSQTMIVVPVFLDKRKTNNVQRVACGSDRTILLTNQY